MITLYGKNGKPVKCSFDQVKTMKAAGYTDAPVVESEPDLEEQHRLEAEAQVKAEAEAKAKSEEKPAKAAK